MDHSIANYHGPSASLIVNLPPQKIMVQSLHMYTDRYKNGSFIYKVLFRISEAMFEHEHLRNYYRYFRMLHGCILQ